MKNKQIIISFVLLSIILIPSKVSNACELNICLIESKPGIITKVQIDKGATEIEKGTETREGVKERLNRIVSESMMSVNLTPSIILKSGTGKINMVNTNQVSQMLEIYVYGNMVYNSGLISPGSTLGNISISLSRGSYDAIAYVIGINDNGKNIGKVGVNIKIIVE